MGKYDFDLELTHQNSLLLILEQVRSQSTILEFGPANGRLTKYLKEQLECKVYLVELDEEAGNQALQYGVDLVTGDIEKYEWMKRYRDIRFDYLIFADVLEHLNNPCEVLVQAKLLLKEEGSILLSVPNFAHNAILINLLNHHFAYNSVGLLDNTHIHMFTKNSLETMINQAGLVAVKRMATYGPTEAIEIPAKFDAVDGIPVSFWKKRPYGEIYQYIYEAKKENLNQNTIENKLIRSTAGSYIQIFWSKTGEFNEDYSQKQWLHLQPKEFEFTFTCNSGYRNFRIDPLEESGVFCLTECEGQTEHGWISLNVTGHNAKFVVDDIYYFDNPDPQWLFYLNEEITQVRIKIEYLYFGSEYWIDPIFTRSTKTFNRLQQKLNSCYIAKDKNKKELDLVLGEVQKLKNQQDELTEKFKTLMHENEELKIKNSQYQKKINEQLLIQQGLKVDYDQLQKEYWEQVNKKRKNIDEIINSFKK